jgi:release factor glutamine methyltransferase
MVLQHAQSSDGLQAPTPERLMPAEHNVNMMERKHFKVIESEVYEPAEDTYLLLKAALEEIRTEDSAIEIGCGRALISSQAAPLAKSFLATDINPHAVRLAKSHGLEAIRADLFRGIAGKFDLIIFNPPYLPTADEERIDGWLNHAFDGGIEGRDTINIFLESLRDHLSSRGRALLLVSSLSGLENVIKKASELGLEVSELSSERYFFEALYVLRLEAKKEGLPH